MKLTTQELEQMRSVDIGAVAAESLPDVSGMTFDNALSRKERISRFLQTVKNPYCFCIGGVGVKIEFAESGPSLQDKLTDFLLRQRSGRILPARSQRHGAGYAVSAQGGRSRIGSLCSARRQKHTDCSPHRG